ncbi:rod shape-determining protein RodA [Pseudofulvibacter geojedonensis]|uniref:Rod shape-determining protein RodA n=1 Tax=Pseudofulvibacter geojedonensis TaxID=1123758 RepID=A0ABW3I4I9_9FLAO
MRQKDNILVRIDWLMILLYFMLVGIGWMSIYSAAYNNDPSIPMLDLPHGRQQIFIGLSIGLIVLIMALEAKFYERFASIIYIVSLLSLVGLFIFGKTISGATSWYSFGGFSIQPSEFAKAATALALAKFLSDIQTNIKLLDHQLKAFLIVFLPALIIVPQPDPGSALVYAAFLFVLYREGLSPIYLLLGFIAAFLFVLTLVLSPLIVSLISLGIIGVLFLKNRKKKPKKWLYIFSLIACIGLSYSVNYIFNNVFEQRHRDRFNIVLGKEVDNKGIGYNTNQSEIAIGSGGWKGKGWLNGTQTKGGFVPEQHTDYIFSTVGEEWGFLGSAFVIGLFITLILRILSRAEKQKSKFSRIYGYSVAAIFFIHFLVNIGMVIGVFPTVGIPLPFFSYGGSGLWGFTILLFIFIKLDANRINEW